MLENPMDILTAFPVRKSRKQKSAFRQEVRAMAESWGYAVTEEKGSFGARNLIIGDPQRAKYLITAHYDTCARLPFPNLITPKNFWLTLAYQIPVILLLLCVPFLAGFLVGILPWASEELAFWVGEIGLFTVLGLMLFGPANKHNANDNTSGVVTALEIAKAAGEGVCIVLFDLEEAGLIGSASYRSRHREQTNRQLIFNLDCVGDGNDLYLFPTGKLKKDRKAMESLSALEQSRGEKSITLHKKGFAYYPSDQVNFPKALGICALRKTKLALYMGRIHTPRDTILEHENVNLLCQAILSYIRQDTEKE